MRWQIDKGLLLVILFFFGLGLVQVYSSSFIFATESYGDALYFFRRQLIFTLVALVALFVFAYIPWRWLERWGWMLWVVAVGGVFATLLPGLSVKVGGAHRWLALPMGWRFEPSELLKVGYPLVLAHFISRVPNPAPTRAWLIRCGLLFLPLVFLLKQPDFGTFAICVTVIFGVFFAFGLKWRYIVAALMVAVPAFYFLVINVPYRYARVAAFLDPWADPSKKGFQVIQSMLSFYSGGLWGAGLGQGQGKLFFLPEAHTDFTLAVLAEEMGFVGVVMMALLFGFILYRGLQIALKAERPYPRAAAIGITLVIALAVFINMGVAMGLLPTKGLSMPFLSYGGSSLLCTSIALGLLLNIDRSNRNKESRAFRGYKIPT